MQKSGTFPVELVEFGRGVAHVEVVRLLRVEVLLVDVVRGRHMLKRDNESRIMLKEGEKEDREQREGNVITGK